MKVFILGTGTPVPTPDLFGSSYVVRVGDEHIMFDCGPATTFKLAKVGLRPPEINHLFFTHHHYDHNADYPLFLLSRWDLSIAEPLLEVRGPTHTALITERLIGPNGAFVHDWTARVEHPASQNTYRARGGTLPRKPPKVNVSDMSAGDGYNGKTWTIRTARAEHVQPWLDSLAYRLDTDEGSVVVSGDTRPCDAVIDLARGADTFVCMCMHYQSHIERIGTAEAVTGTLGAAKMAAAAGVRRLILVHVEAQFATSPFTERGVADISQIYEGEVIFARELMQIDLK